MESIIQPTQIFTHLYKNENALGESAEEMLDFATMSGHILRDSTTFKFLYFDELRQAASYTLLQ